jgi:hypothetical protein
MEKETEIKPHSRAKTKWIRGKPLTGVKDITQVMKKSTEKKRKQ